MKIRYLLFMVPLQGILELPALVMFRNGGMVVIYGDNVQVSFLTKFSQISSQNLYLIWYKQSSNFSKKIHFFSSTGGNGEAAEGLAYFWVDSQDHRCHWWGHLSYDDMITFLRVNISRSLALSVDDLFVRNATLINVVGDLNGRLIWSLTSLFTIISNSIWKTKIFRWMPRCWTT